ncbi:hypothetical protein BDK51DRAFT_16881 [Blyttiomyces helicus]|uniref:L-ornithine N(5)-monooxygenase [NAD(P)H] n=1 Tax=Blyttiomyces helicus TaxID=388810 RepID=A0A4P9WIL0_9FUNG|nr:hypothetical protein BDK51DRAFT_16881 [Blyttiomyces helicus]|eukprot:RKO91278.1 hypothetical protein BDK51DRAFT_16881 [Blyttiomyces helicus]
MQSPQPTHHDVIIIGGGPQALAVASRLREQTPGALYTDTEHERLLWHVRHKKRAPNVQNIDPLAVHSESYPCAATPRELSILVLDKGAGKWMHQWRRGFEALEISHLRSPMFFHPDPSDPDALKAFALREGREKELVEIEGVVSRMVSKHEQKKKRYVKRKPLGSNVNERDRCQYFTPSSTLFCDFCDEVIDRYNLANIIQQGDVRDIQHTVHPATSESIFHVSLSDGRASTSRYVVLALGAATIPNIPRPPIGEERCAMCHSSEVIARGFVVCPALQEKINRGEETCVALVGGGLTSAQIADVLLRKGVSHVYLICRGHLKVKHFDFPLTWLGKYKNLHHADFWSQQDPAARVAMIREARNGGSITPAYHAILQSHRAAKRLTIKPHTTVADQTWCSASRNWNIHLAPATGPAKTICCDHVYWATGSTVSIGDLPFLANFRAAHPIELCCGFPCITRDLQWRPDVPLFVVGGYAALEIGPAAFNLLGSRSGAERIVRRMGEMMEGGCDSCGVEETTLGAEGEDDGEWDGLEELRGGAGNWFEALGEIDA